jgi:hypothetical protein
MFAQTERSLVITQKVTEYLPIFDAKQPVEGMPDERERFVAIDYLMLST